MSNQTGIGFKELYTQPLYKLDSLSYLINKEGYNNYTFISNISVDRYWFKFYEKFKKLEEEHIIEPLVFTGLNIEDREKFDKLNEEYLDKKIDTLSRDGISKYAVIEPAYEELTKGREKINYRYYNYTLEANFIYLPHRHMCLIFTHGSIVGHCLYSMDNHTFLHDLAEVCKMNKRPKEKQLKFITMANGSFRLISKKIEPAATGNLLENYNDDFEEISTRVDSFIENDSQGLVLLHGIPGSGKTEYIVDLIRRHNKKEFIYVPETILPHLNDPSFMSFVMHNLEDQILIVEDAERALKKREEGSSASTILNLTDGMIGRTIKSKIICTFNTSIDKIDKALLRNGRLHTIYEFKELEESKMRKLCEKHNIEYSEKFKTPADFYSFKNNKFNNKKEEQVNKIGFR